MTKQVSKKKKRFEHENKFWISDLNKKESDKKKYAHRKRMLDHARQRAKERFNINLNKRVRLEMIKLCTKETQIKDYKKDNGNLYEINYNGIWMRVIYNKTQDCFITVLPSKKND